MKNYFHQIRFLLKDRNRPFLQFVKYGFFGGLATAADMLVFYLLSIWVLPALTGSDWVVRCFSLDVGLIQEAARARNFLINSTVSFLAGSIVAYVTNILWVFDSISEKRHKEMCLFLLFSVFSMAVSAGCGWFLIQFFDMQTTVSFVVKVGVSLCINFAARKFVVFRSGLVLGSQAG